MYLNWQLVTGITCSALLPLSNAEATAECEIIAETVIAEVFSSQLPELGCLLNNSETEPLQCEGRTQSLFCLP